MRVFLFVVSENEAENIVKRTMKADFSINCISGLFKVKHFRVTGKPTKHFMTPQNNIGFNSKGSDDMEEGQNYEEIASSDHPRHGTPTNIRRNLIPPENRSLGCILLLIVWV